jgi:hypothetical protein
MAADETIVNTNREAYETRIRKIQAYRQKVVETLD